MRPFLEFWLSLSRLNRIAVDCLLFWLTVGTVVGLGAMGSGIVREIVPPFLALTVIAGGLGALVATIESIRLDIQRRKLPHEEFDQRGRNLRNLRLALLMAVANAFPVFIQGLVWMRGVRFFS
jgi:hypothetical protein